MMSVKNSKKLDELCRWSRIGEVNEMLDSGVSPNKVHGWIKSTGFVISHPLVYDYAKRRKLTALGYAVAEQSIVPIDTERLQEAERVPILNRDILYVKQIRNELDALEAIIQLGYQNLCELPIEAVTPKLMLEAIALKNKITDGYNCHTKFGFDAFMEIEQRKMKMMVDLVSKYISEDERDDFYAEADFMEGEFYKGTEFYINYLEARGYL